MTMAYSACVNGDGVLLLVDETTPPMILKYDSTVIARDLRSYCIMGKQGTLNRFLCKDKDSAWYFTCLCYSWMKLPNEVTKKHKNIVVKYGEL